ncbi:hypothetical protein [Roseimicrobium gellanilyticum]|uniref:hypothetical protein n=1 Tax=Roseimicrobium gellanilyticum TaxID=748857 RepID=UPI001B85E6EE|nr:hypothetical protein [Roseimicrobium gellanilyticum]
MFLAASARVEAQRNSWTSDDVRPLTKLPWLGAELRPLDVMLDEIFREPNETIRYAVLAEYLAMIPVEQLGEAYNRCILLEGKQTPDELVEFLLHIWARRDPHACWKKAKTLFDLVGIEEGILCYDSYMDRPKITVQNRDAFRASRYWLQQKASILGFITGLQDSPLPEEERVRLMRECVDIWFTKFKTWPNKGLYSDYRWSLWGRFRTFDLTLDELRPYPLTARDNGARAESEIALRRWLEKAPQEAVQILDKITVQNEEWKAYQISEIEAGREVGPQGALPFPSTEWLWLWRGLDPEGMLTWARRAGSVSDPVVLAARGMLLSQVDERTRAEWFQAARDADEHDAVLSDLLGQWSIWDTRAAMRTALGFQKHESPHLSSTVQSDATNNFLPPNLRHGNLGFIREFDVELLRKRFDDGYLYDWATEAMEAWGRVDVGEAARYGLEGLMKLNHYPRSDLIKFLKGENNEFSDTGDMIDRTFCYLRVWAVVRPDEMKTWIATIQDSAMRDALTWLLENPWGTGENVEQ